MRLQLARILRGAGLALVLAWLACAQTDPGGHWEGTLKRESGDVRISLDLAMDAKAGWVASMGVVPDMKGLVVMDLAVDGKSVKFTAVELMMVKFELALDSGGAALKGTLTNRQGTSTPIEFQRAGAAKVELLPPSPAVSKEFEGDWEGVLKTPNREFRMIVHFKNQPGNTVAATLDAPDTMGFGLPLNNVKQTGRKIEVGIRIARATFEGTLNQEGTELAGQFLRDGDGTPLTLRKK